jgi:hypothetical protein
VGAAGWLPQVLPDRCSRDILMFALALSLLYVLPLLILKGLIVLQVHVA